MTLPRTVAEILREHVTLEVESIDNLPARRAVGFQANRRLLNVQRLSHDCHIGEEALERVLQPLDARGQRVAAMRFADSRVQALLSALLGFRLLPRGFSNRDLRERLASLVGHPVGAMSRALLNLKWRLVHITTRPSSGMQVRWS